MKLIIEVLGTQFVNKGAELMLRSCVQRMKEFYPDCTIVHELRPGAATIQDLNNIGVSPRLFEFKIKSFRMPLIEKLLETKIRTSGFILSRDIKVVLDASGFAYGDQWGRRKLLDRIRYFESIKKNGGIVILMPQALGPFVNKIRRRDVNRLLEVVEIVYARDQRSYEYIHQASSKEYSGKIKQAPDFTAIIKTASSGVEPLGNYFVTPNEKIVKMSTMNRFEYIQLLSEHVKLVQKAGFNPFFLVHEGKGDLELCKSTNELLIDSIPILVEEDALVVKSVIGKCSAGFSSRFHGIVNGLSQGVPVLGLGWSHKYKELYKTWNFDEGLSTNASSLGECFNHMVENGLEYSRVKLRIKTEEIVKSINSMWDEIKLLIDKRCQ